MNVVDLLKSTKVMILWKDGLNKIISRFSVAE
jgi:hypothetical protein